MTKINSSSHNLPSDTTEDRDHNRQTGQVYFVRHGESTSNEHNIFAGVLDIDLTYGIVANLNVISAPAP